MKSTPEAHQDGATARRQIPLVPKYVCAKSNNALPSITTVMRRLIVDGNALSSAASIGNAVESKEKIPY
jgi:hypothetical protein